MLDFVDPFRAVGNLRRLCVDAPNVDRREMKVWDVATTAKALELARQWRVHVLVLMAACAGRGDARLLRCAGAIPI